MSNGEYTNLLWECGLDWHLSFCRGTNQSIEETVWQCLHVSSKEDYIQKPECLFRPDVRLKVIDSVIICMWDWEHWMLHSIVLKKNSSRCRCLTLLYLYHFVFSLNSVLLYQRKAIGLVHPKINIRSSFTHLYVIPNLYDFFCRTQKEMFHRMFKLLFVVHVLLTKQAITDKSSVVMISINNLVIQG